MGASIEKMGESLREGLMAPIKIQRVSESTIDTTLPLKCDDLDVWLSEVFKSAEIRNDVKSWLIDEQGVSLEEPGDVKFVQQDSVLNSGLKSVTQRKLIKAIQNLTTTV